MVREELQGSCLHRIMLWFRLGLAVLTCGGEEGIIAGDVRCVGSLDEPGDPAAASPTYGDELLSTTGHRILFCMTGQKIGPLYINGMN